MKVYTGTGDRGKTSLFSGERIEKSDMRVEAYGDVDELNALIGSILNVMPDGCTREVNQLEQILTDLFQIGACLASTPGNSESAAFQDLPVAKTAWLEQSIDQMDEVLPRLTHFILPMGHPAASACHVARCVRPVGKRSGPNAMSCASAGRTPSKTRPRGRLTVVSWAI